MEENKIEHYAPGDNVAALATHIIIIAAARYLYTM